MNGASVKKRDLLLKTPYQKIKMKKLLKQPFEAGRNRGWQTPAPGDHFLS
jgi:hypothetical protein